MRNENHIWIPKSPKKNLAIGIVRLASMNAAIISKTAETINRMKDSLILMIVGLIMLIWTDNIPDKENSKF